MNFLCDHFDALALLALPVFPGPGLDTAGNGHLHTLFEPLGDELGGVLPGDDVDEVGLGLFPIPGEEATQ